MKRLNCPKCSREYVKRVSRNSTLEKLFSAFYIYPFRCQVCGHRFTRVRWGILYRKVDFDRREYERLPVNFPVSIFGEKGDYFKGVLHNLSMRGCAVSADVRYREQTILRLEMHVPNVSRPLVVEAAAVRNDGTERTGLEFLRLHDVERQRLRLLIQGLLASRNTEAEDQVFGLILGTSSTAEGYAGSVPKLEPPQGFTPVP